jgi:hypothetical protein
VHGFLKSECQHSSYRRCQKHIEQNAKTCVFSVTYVAFWNHIRQYSLNILLQCASGQWSGPGWSDCSGCLAGKYLSAWSSVEVVGYSNRFYHCTNVRTHMCIHHIVGSASSLCGCLLQQTMTCVLCHLHVFCALILNMLVSFILPTIESNMISDTGQTVMIETSQQPEAV